MIEVVRVMCCEAVLRHGIFFFVVSACERISTRRRRRWEAVTFVSGLCIMREISVRNFLHLWLTLSHIARRYHRSPYCHRLPEKAAAKIIFHYWLMWKYYPRLIFALQTKRKRKQWEMCYDIFFCSAENNNRNNLLCERFKSGVSWTGIVGSTSL